MAVAITFHAVLVVVALAHFGLAFFNVGGKVNLVAGGLFCWLLAATFVA